MTYKLKNTLLFIAVLTVGLTACKKDKPIEETPIENPILKPNTSQNQGVLNLGNDVNAKFFVQVEDESGNTVSGVQINIGNKTGTTDNNGIFIVDNVTVKSKLAYITAKKSGFFLGSRSAIPSESSTNSIKITLLALDIIATIQSGQEVIVNATNDLSIDFKGDYVDENGNAYSGIVDVAVKHMPAFAPETPFQMPGMLYAQNNNNQAGVLETYGMAAIEIFGSNGQELQIADGSNATLHMTIDANQLVNAPATIPLWHFDELLGYWIEEGEATLVNGEYVGNVAHFSFWNCDDFYDVAQLNGLVIDANGNPIPNAVIEVITLNASTIGTVNPNGSFFTYVPANQSISFNIYDDCGNLLQSFPSGPFSTNSINSQTFNITLNPSNAVNVSGLFYDCNNAIVLSGYAEITIGTATYYQNITNGTINITLNSCNLSSSLDITCYDLTNFQSSTTLTLPISLPNTNVGSILACNVVNEYISYTINSDPPVFLNDPSIIYCSQNYDTLTNTFLDGLNVHFFQYPASFGITLEDETVGTYLTSNFNSGSTPGGSIYASHNTPPHTISSTNVSSNSNFQFNLINFGPVGGYVDISFSGTYIPFNQTTPSTVSGQIHVLRDQ